MGGPPLYSQRRGANFVLLIQIVEKDWNFI
jgi:hypothetical protein